MYNLKIFVGCNLKLLGIHNKVWGRLQPKPKRKATKNFVFSFGLATQQSQKRHNHETFNLIIIKYFIQFQVFHVSLPLRAFWGNFRTAIARSIPSYEKGQIFRIVRRIRRPFQFDGPSGLRSFPRAIVTKGLCRASVNPPALWPTKRAGDERKANFVMILSKAWTDHRRVCKDTWQIGSDGKGGKVWKVSHCRRGWCFCSRSI